MSKETDFSVGTVVSDEFLDAVQEVMTGLAHNFRLEKQSSTAVRVVAGAGSSQSSIIINGQMRYTTTTKSLTISGGAGTKDVYATADTSDRDFALEFGASGYTPSATNYRKIGTVVWDGSAITSVVNLAGDAPTNDPTFTGTVTIPTPASGSDTTVAASTEWVRDRIGDVAPAAHASSHHSGGGDPIALGSLAGTIGSSQIAAGAVLSAAIAASQVTSSHLASNAVTTAAITNLAVTTGKIANAAVGTTQLANDAVTQAIIAAGAVGTSELIDLNVTTGKIADLAVTTGKLADDAVTAAKLGANAVRIGHEHSFSVMGIISVPSGTTAVIPGFFMRVASGTARVLKSCRHKIGAGTSCTITVKVNGVTVASGISVTSTSTTTSLSDTAIADGDFVEITVTAVSGSPENLSFTIFSETTNT